MQPTHKPTPVTCSTCRHFHLDTTGPSYNSYTHVYFMGTCALGCTPHSPIKQFANKPHICPHHQPINSQNSHQSH